MHEPIRYFISNLLSGMRSALPGEPGSASPPPCTPSLQLVLK